MTTAETTPLARLGRDFSFWNRLESILGDGWRLRGWTFDYIASFSDQYDTSHEIRGSLARRILEISERKT